MKNIAKKVLLSSATALLLGLSAQAQTAVIELTGATAFRAGALDSIRAGFTAAGTPFKTAYNGTTYNASTRAILRGNFVTSDGTTLSDIVIRTFFSGSTEGLRALDNADYSASGPGPFADTYFTVGSISALAAGSTTQNFAGATEAAAADLAFSDVEAGSVPTIDSSDFISASVGAVTFTMLTNDGNSLAPFNNLTNVSSQNFRALMLNGLLPLSFFTGITADSASRVVAVGRNDGSGTRVVYLAETGFGPTNLVRQFQASNTTSNGAGGPGTTGVGIINQMQLVPATSPSFETDTTPTDANAGTTNQNQRFDMNTSTVFENAVVNGNGGYASGSVLRRIFGYSSRNTQIVSATGSQIRAAAPVALVTSLATADAIGAITQGARALAYDGYSITPAAPLSDADKAKVTSGQYTLWSFEQLLGKDLDVNEQGVFDTIVSNIGAVIETNGTGIAVENMNVSRSQVGETVGL